jgi:U32 family peptidase
MKQEIDTTTAPSILAPAGNKPSFLSAIAAGADAIYCGLKSMNARMAAVNFTMEELVPLVALAHDKGVKVFIALNSLLKPEELGTAGNTVAQLHRYVRPDALIIQDLAYVPLARRVGFSGELHLSTLANVSFPLALSMVRQELHIDRVVLPRELNVDEIRTMADACPKGLALEIFVHGALCFGVSGRCYWSSYMGGKSGLRGRCVQPCRRRYAEGEKTGRFFSCQDLSLDVLGKVLLSIPQVRAWKIEGRRKGPHYVYYTVQAYRLLRDEGGNPLAKKAALDLLAQALGRPGTHYNFLPQRPQNPVNANAQTGSGLVVGKCQGLRNKPYIIPREALLSGDLLRTGYEDDAWHSLHKVRKYVPKRGRYYLKFSGDKGPDTGTPVFLVDRVEAALVEKINVLETLLAPLPILADLPVADFRFPVRQGKPFVTQEMPVFRQFNRVSDKRLRVGCWLTADSFATAPKENIPDIFWWLPPVVWPENEPALVHLIDQLILAGGRHFVLNAPWQVAYFTPPTRYDLWAGPFCNLTNPVAIETLSDRGISGVMVTPELGEKELLLLPQHSLVPMGIVVSGHWPLCVARGVSSTLKQDQAYISPKGEQAWVRRYGPDEWVFPNWKIDLTEKKDALKRAGYQVFIHLVEPVPQAISLKSRPGLWNWEVGLT